jgi:hypothetical protein
MTRARRGRQKKNSLSLLSSLNLNKKKSDAEKLPLSLSLSLSLSVRFSLLHLDFRAARETHTALLLGVQNRVVVERRFK